MGTKSHISCRNCNHTFYDLNEGVGKLYHPENIFIGINRSPIIYSILGKEDSIKEQVEELILNGAIPIANTHHLYRCTSCNNLESKFYFSLKTSKQYHDKEYYVPTYYCASCNHVLQLAKIEKMRIISPASHKNNINATLLESDKVSEWNCPKCGHFEIARQITIRWD